MQPSEWNALKRTERAQRLDRLGEGTAPRPRELAKKQANELPRSIQMALGIQTPTPVKKAAKKTKKRATKKRAKATKKRRSRK